MIPCLMVMPIRAVKATLAASAHSICPVSTLPMAIKMPPIAAM